MSETKCKLFGHEWIEKETELRYPDPVYGWHFRQCSRCQKLTESEKCKTCGPKRMKRVRGV